MKWLSEAIENYDNLSESEKVHVDAALDHFNTVNYSNNDTCVCGVPDCSDEYAHVTSGY